MVLEMYKYIRKYNALALLVIFAPWLSCLQATAQDKGTGDIRPSVIAGTWYPGTRDGLSHTVEHLLSGVETPRLYYRLKALVVPHAGYKYSGDVAAHAYKLLQGRHFRRIVLVGPSHHVAFKGVSVNLQSGYKTPLGIVPVDQEMAKKIVKSDTEIRWLKQAHAYEHCLEIQLPFLQTVLHDFQIIPIIMGQQDYSTCLRLAEVLVQVLGKSKDTLLLASSDLSHYHTYNQAKKLDLQFIKQVQRFNPQGLANYLSIGKCEACGGGPVVTILLAAKAMGANKSLILKYANSGDVTGDRSRVVGYVSAALITSSDRGPHPK